MGGSKGARLLAAGGLITIYPQPLAGGEIEGRIGVSAVVAPACRLDLLGMELNVSCSHGTYWARSVEHRRPGGLPPLPPIEEHPEQKAVAPRPDERQQLIVTVSY